MELFIRANDIFMEIHKVTLKDGHIPMIGDQIPPNLNETEHGFVNPYQMEPAVWFKVKVVDSISIDCTKRSIMWNSDSYFDDDEESSENVHILEDKTSLPPGGSQSNHAPKRTRRRKVSDSMYIGGELYGFESDLDELFDTIQLAVVNFASSTISRDKFNSEIMRMLHCHVLPVVKLTAEDVPRMKQLYLEEERCIREIDQFIMQKDKQMQEISAAMQRQRAAFLTNLVVVQDQRSTLSGEWKLCSKKVAKMLVEDIESDIYDVYQNLDDLQKSVQEAKGQLVKHGHTSFRDSTSSDNSPKIELYLSENLPPCEKSTTSLSPSDIALQLQGKECLGCDKDYKHILAEKREERNDCHLKYEKLLYARENLKDYISESCDVEEKPQKKSLFNRGSKQNVDPLHNIYIGMREKLEDVKNEAKALIDRKVLIISVKEAIRTTLEELELHDESTGYDTGVMHGSRPTDVLSGSRKPKEWLSLAEKMSELVGHHSNQACLKHNNFCSVIADRCQASVFEKRLVDISYGALDGNGSQEKEGCPQEQQPSSETDSGIIKTDRVESKISDSNTSNSICSSIMDDKENSPVESLGSASSDLGNSVGAEDTKSSSPSLARRSSDLCLYEGSVQRISMTDDDHMDSILQVEGQFNDEEIVIVHTGMNNSREHLRKTIEDIKCEIHTHFKSMSKLIQRSLDSNTQVAFKKIWLCYENHFYEMLMAPLMDLYKTAYKPVTERLEAMVPTLSVEDLDLEDTSIANMLKEIVVNDAQTESRHNMPNCDSKDETLGGLATINNNLLENGCDSNDTSFEGPTEDKLEQTSPENKVQLRKSSRSIKGAFRGRLTHPLSVTCDRKSPFPGQISPRGDMKTGQNGLQRIKIHYPVSVTVIRDTQSWPTKSSLPEISENHELGMDSLDFNRQSSETSIQDTFRNIRRSLFNDNEIVQEEPPEKQKDNEMMCSPIIHRQVKLKPEFHEQFNGAKNCMAETLEGKTPLSQMQSLMRCLREVTNCLSDYQSKYCSNTNGACSDDIIDMLIILLLNCDVNLVASLYPHLMLLTDTLPPFFEGGPFQFCLVQFSVAFQFLQDRILLKNRSSPGNSI